MKMKCDVTLITRICLVIISLFDIIPGLIHYFAPDGGANSIAGIKLNWEDAATITVNGVSWNASQYHEETVLVMFAGLGLIQVKLGALLALLAVWLPQNNILYYTVILLFVFQLFKIIMDLAGYRNIRDVASEAPGQYKPTVVGIFYLIAFICQLVWQNQKRKRRIDFNTI